MSNIFYFIWIKYKNKKIKNLRKQNVRTTTKFLSYVIKNSKHFNENES